MHIKVEVPGGDTIDFVSDDDSGDVRAVLSGRAIPVLPFVHDVRTVFDVGAAAGAATLHLARHYRDAVVHAFETDLRRRGLLERNTSRLDNVTVVPPSPAGEPAAAARWAAAHDVTALDVLRVAANWGAGEVVGDLGVLLQTVKVVYVGYRSRAERRHLESVLAHSHELYVGVLELDHGDCIYLRRDLSDGPEATAHLRQLLQAAVG